MADGTLAYREEEWIGTKRELVVPRRISQKDGKAMPGSYAVMTSAARESVAVSIALAAPLRCRMKIATAATGYIFSMVSRTIKSP